MKVLNAAIEMIASHDREGNIRPIRFRIQEDEENKVIKVNKVVNKSKERIAGKDYLKYTCMVTINDTHVLCELNFELMTSTWRLFKI